MGLNTYKAIRDYLKADAPLSAWWSTNYPAKTINHFIGYKKPINANDYPALCYVPVRSQIGEQPFDRLTVSIVLSINEKGMTNDVLDGVQKSDEAATLIVAALRAPTSPFNIDRDIITVTTDLGLTHPFYDTELQFTLLSLR